MSNENIDILESLIKMKKKSDAPKEKQKSFYQNWISLAKDEGFTERTERYLYEGLSFCGCKPFKDYLSQSNKQDIELDKFFNGKLYDKNNDVTFRMLSHLLALFLNDSNNPKVLSKLIKEIPHICKNKDGKLLGTANKTIEKYFFGKLRSEAKFISLSELQIEPNILENFIKLMRSFIFNMTSEKVPNTSKVKEWLDSYKSNETGESNDKNDTSDKSASFAENPSIIQKQKTSTIIANVLQDIIAMEKENAKYKEELFKVHQTLFEERENLKVTRQEVAELNKAISLLKNELAEKDELLKNKEADIEERIKAMDVLEREFKHQSDETLQRIASQIKIEYEDFATVLETPMNEELGENLRWQLKNIFKILEDGGMKIK